MSPSRCHNEKHPHFVDHLVMNASLMRLAAPQTFIEHLYLPIDDRYVLADHCALSIDLQLLQVRDRTEGTMDAANAAASPVESPPAVVPTDSSKPLLSSEAQPIKGNLGRSGKKLYHLPSCPDYQSTKIELGKGERLFATEEAALNAGWKKAGNCR
jgi:hypothetical protein